MTPKARDIVDSLNKILCSWIFLGLLIFATIIYFGGGVYSYHKQLAEERATFQARLDNLRAGESTRIGGYQFMKISEVKTEAGNVR